MRYLDYLLMQRCISCGNKLRYYTTTGICINCQRDMVEKDWDKEEE